MQLHTRFAQSSSTVRAILIQYPYTYGIIFALVVIGAVVGATFFFGHGEVGVVYEQAPATYILAHATSVPLAIEGVLVAKEEAVIAAQTQGRLTSVPAREGARVVAGDVLAVVGQPVLAAQRDVLVTSIRATQAQRSVAETQSAGAQNVAVVSEAGGRASTDASVVLAESQLRTAHDGLVNALESNYLSATEALKFLADTSSLANSDVSQLRAETARFLAGSLRAEYLGQSVRVGGSSDGFLDALNSARGAGGVYEEVALLALTDRLLEGLALLAQTYDVAERPAYERGGGVTETERLAYNTYRTAVRSAQLSVEQSRGAYVTAGQVLASARTSADETVAIRGAELSQATALREGERVLSSATLANLEAELCALDASLGEAVVRAPYSGVVTDVFLDAGAYVSPGAPLVRVQSASGFEVRTTIPERYASGLTEGAPVVFTGGSIGVLDRLSPQVDAQSGGVTAFVVIDTARGVLTAGSRLRGELSLRVLESDAVYAIPHRYISSDWSGPVLRTATSSLPVTVVRDTHEYLYVRGQGLSDGLTLILN